MNDRDKVIKGLEICYCPPSKCEDCPYYDLPDDQSCGDVLCLDALALLKEQEQAMKEKDGTISNLIAQIKEISQCYERVVRCKDCKHGKKSPTFRYYSEITWCNKHSTSHNDDWFCADGRKKNE